ncbi:MAG: amidohydrolase family protein [Pseudomonadota bacterium]|nr:amidohydrolase family protein [Pseudomonadota bacterium]
MGTGVLGAPRAPTQEPRAYRPTWAWTDEGLVRAPVFGVDERGILCDPRGLPVEDRRGLLVPGFVNAHTHLELGPVPTAKQAGFVSWVAQFRAGAPPSAAQAGRGVFQAIRAGTAALGEITNNGWSQGALTAARMPARVWHEVFGIDCVDVPGDVSGRLTPHAPHSTHPNMIKAAAALPGPWSIHFDEDPEEAAWLASGTGAWRPFLQRSGRDLSAFPIPGLSPAAYLASMGVLDRRALLVHATCTRGADLDLIAAARVCLCVRSNEHITGRLPDVPGMLDRGIPLAVGTDSLASTPDLDPLAEAAALRRAFPQIAVEVWLHALTAGGADALDLPVGRLTNGLAPGLLLVDVPDEDPLGALFDGTVWPRRWLACPEA